MRSATRQRTTVPPAPAAVDEQQITLGPNDAPALSAQSSGGTAVKVELVDSVVRRLTSGAAAVIGWAGAGGSVDLSVLRSRIVDNRPRSGTPGGAIAVTGYEGGSVIASIVNSVVAGNRTREPQGMIQGWASRGAHVDLTIRHSTVTSYDGVGVRLGEYFAGTTTATIASSILWWNGKESGAALWTEGHVDGTVTVDASDNLLGSRSVGFGTTFNDLGNNVDADPLFAQPRRTYRLRAGSPAVDAVSCTLAHAASGACLLEERPDDVQFADVASVDRGVHLAQRTRRIRSASLRRQQGRCTAA